jgi:hypothetical protein
MSSEQLADGVNPLDAELAATWDVLKGYSGRDTDLGIARRFGAASAAYSLRDIGAMNGRVVKARRSGDDLEEDFSANQVQDGTLENWVNGKLESTLPADVATAAAAYSLRKVKADYNGDAVRIRRSSDDIEVDVAFDSEDKVSASSTITNVAEQGGESGQTTATTLGDFISGTDAFVHTWYDQAGSNDATQETAANQPKIAEGGALLADGVSFDGDFFLQKTTTDTTTEASIFGVHTKGTSTGSGTRPIGYQESASAGTNTLAFAMDNSIRFDGDAATTSTQTIPTSGLFLATTIKVSNTEANNFLNSVSNIADNALTLNDTDVRFTLGFASTTPDYSYDGSIQEAIFYTSDQSDNRFKIESNINNYYGLYNDANEMAEPWTSPDATVTNESKDGFTVTNPVSGDYVAFELAIPAPHLTPSRIRVSFMADDPDDALNNISCRTSANGTSGSTLTINNGFNSIDINNNVGSGNTTTHLNIQFNAGTKTATLSNFKVSRIARNGFVETWYDQSGNGFDLKSQSADTQPFIVNNGGFTGGVYSPSRLNNSTKQYLEISDPDFDSTNITSSKFGWLAVMANMEENDGSQAGGVILGNTRNTQTFPAGTIALNLSDTNPNGRMFVTNLKTGSTGDFIGAVDNDDLFTSETIGTAVVDGSSLSTFLNGTTGSGTFTDLTLTSDVHFKIFQASDAANNPYYQNAAQGFIKELMFMQGDMIDDIATIRNEVNNHYNIF